MTQNPFPTDPASPQAPNPEAFLAAAGALLGPRGLTRDADLVTLPLNGSERAFHAPAWPGASSTGQVSPGLTR